MGARAPTLAAVVALLFGSCVESLGVTERKWACTSDADCVAGWICRPDPGGSGRSVCLSEADPSACSFTKMNLSSIGIPLDLLTSEGFLTLEQLRFVDPLGRGELALWAIEPNTKRAWLFERGPTGFVGHVAAELETGEERSATFADLDGDGDEDAWLFGGNAGPALRLNGGDHFHTDASGDWTLPADAPDAFTIALDFDGDGDLDVLSGGDPVGDGPLRLDQNEEGGVVGGTRDAKLDASSWLGPGWQRPWLSAAAVGDLDGDGDLDLVASSHEVGREIYVFRNDGDHFSRDYDPFESGGPVYDSSGAGLGDYDGDGDLDLLITTYLGETWPERKEDALFAAVDGHFVKRSASETGLDAEGLDGRDGRFWDYDSDGDLDVVIGGYNADRIQIYRNDGAGRFERTDAALGVVERAGVDEPPAIGDYDGDGDLDLVYDGALYRNDCPAHDWVALRVEVDNPDGSSRVAIGARVVVDPARDGFRFPGSLLREVTRPDNGYWLHVGLGTHPGPVDAKVVFPGAGSLSARTVVFRDLPTRRRLVLHRDGAVATCDSAGRGGGCHDAADPAICEIGYEGSDCSACASPYEPDGGVCTAPEGCSGDGGWLATGRLPLDGPGRFSIAAPEDDPKEPTVVDHRTGLEWRRCPVGSSWELGPARCTSTGIDPYLAGYAEDLCSRPYAEESDWRLPSLREMETLLDYSEQLPSLDPTTSPGGGFVRATYWTSTVKAGSHDRAIVDPYSVRTSWDPADSPHYAICVRGGGVASGPRFAVHASDGSTVRDRWTGLEWTRCALGQRWNDGGCEDDPELAGYQDREAACAALAATGEAFRLPTARELRSLRSFCQEPYYDAAAFRFTPPLVPWTSTFDPGDEDRLLTVTLGGAASASRAFGEPGPALCVR